MPRHQKPGQKAVAVSTFDASGTGFIEASLAVDGVLTGTDGADVFALRSGDGDVVIENYDRLVDRILFDYGSWSDYMVFGRLYDGQTWDNFIGTASFTVSAVDVNEDGITDTRITVNDDSVTVLGLSPDLISGWLLVGG